MSDCPERVGWTFELVGGQLCLDFANTVGGIRGVDPRDHLGGYLDLVDWARQACAIDEAVARRLEAEGRARPDEAARVFAEAIELREAIYATFLAAARGRSPREEDLAAVNGALGRALAHRRVLPGPDGHRLGWEEAPGALDAVIWPVAASAAELLTSKELLARVRICGLFDEDECGWLFVDQTRSHTRRWCSMKDCGNRAKARRHYHRVRAER